MWASARGRLAQWDTLLAVLLVVVVLVGWQTTTGFITTFNISSAIGVMAEKALMVLPLTLLIVCREIDISVASMAALSATACGMVLDAGAPVPAAIAISIVVGIACGVVNAVLVTVLGLPSLVVTLGTLALFRGLCYVLLGSNVMTTVPAFFTALGTADIGSSPIPWDIVPFLVLAPVFAIVLHGLPTGRRIYAIGGSPETAQYSGVRVDRIKFCLFVASGALCGIAGAINFGRISEATPDTMLGYELDAITIVFLGGVSFLGGKGRMSAVLWALALVCLLENMLQLNNVSAYGQGTAIGILLIVSLVFSNAARSVSDRLRRVRRRRLAPGHGASPPEPDLAHVE